MDKQGLTVKKIEYPSWLYKNIVRFGVENAGHLKVEPKIWIFGSPVPIHKQFNRNLKMDEVQSVLAGYVLG